jgi:hypothetical protein
MIAMIFSLILVMLAASYATLSLRTVKMSHRAYHSTAATNIAELGIEEGMWLMNNISSYGETLALNQATKSDGTQPWTVATSGKGYEGIFSNISIGSTATASTKIHIDTSASEPVVVSRAIISIPTEDVPVERWVEVKLTRASGSGNAITSRLTFDTNGQNVEFDSWNSRQQGKDATTGEWTYTSYAKAFEHDEQLFGVSSGKLLGHDWVHDDAPIATVDINGTTGVDNSKIYGSVAVGSSTTNTIKVSANGSVGPFGTSLGTMAPGSVSTDFKMDLPIKNYYNDPVPPGDDFYVAGQIWKPATITSKKKSTVVTPDPSTNITYETITSTTSFVSGKTYVTSSAIDFNALLTIPKDAEVVIIIDVPEGENAISLSGNASGIKLEEGAKLRIYTPGNISVAGQGIMNESGTSGDAGFSGNMTIYGTGTGSLSKNQTIDIKGNGTLSAVVYAPYANITVAGGGDPSKNPDVCGSFVGNKITFSGNMKFHYDEALASETTSLRWAVKQWRELVTTSERAPYDAYLK